MSVCVVRSHPGRNCTGAALVRRRCGEWCGLDTDRFQNGKSQNRFPPIWPCDTCRSFGGGSPTPQQFPKNRVNFEARKQLRSNRQLKPRPMYPMELWWFERGGACLAKYKTLLGHYYVVYKETTTTSVRLYYPAVKDKKNSFSTVFLSITAE